MKKIKVKANQVKTSWLKAVNLILLQWFFIRLTKCTERRIVEYNLKEVSLMPEGSMAIGGNGKTETWQWYSVQGWVVPTTGWKKEFNYLNKKPFFVKCTKPHCI